MYIPTWGTVKLVTEVKSPKEFYDALGGKGYRVSSWASFMLRQPQFKIVDNRTEVAIALVSAKDLGSKKDADTRRIFAMAKKVNLQLCPPEVGPQLCLQYNFSEFLLIGGVKIAMHPITDYDGLPGIFKISYDTVGPWFSTDTADDYEYNSNDYWAFVKP